MRSFTHLKLQIRALISAVMLAGTVWGQSTTVGYSLTEESRQPVTAWVFINEGYATALQPGADAQTIEAVKTLARQCPNVGVTLEKDQANFIVLVGHDPHRPWWRRDNKIAVFNREGHEIYSTSTRTMGNAVKDACDIISRR